MTDAPTSAPAKPKSNSSGCVFILAALAALLAGGFIWNAVTGNDSSPTRTISRTTYSGTWPLTLDTVKIGCDGHNPYVLVGDTFYALDGTGRSAGYKDIDPIWAYDSNGDGLKVDISGLRAKATALC